MSDNLARAAAWTAGGLGVGLGARLIKHLADIYRDRDVNSVASIPKPVPNVAGVPVKVTKEEADELERNGVRVQRMPKTAEGFISGLASGAAGAGAAYGGWKLIDSILDKQKRTAAQRKLDKARSRVQALLSGTPEPADVKVAEVMAVAEALYFKQAGFLSAGADALGTVASPVAPVLGILGVMGGVAAYNRAREASKHERAAKSLKKQYLTSPEQAPQLSMVPVLEEDAAGSPASQAAHPEA